MVPVGFEPTRISPVEYIVKLKSTALDHSAIAPLEYHVVVKSNIYLAYLEKDAKTTERKTRRKEHIAHRVLKIDDRTSGQAV